LLAARLGKLAGSLKSVVTSLALAGFEASEPVVTSLAGFAFRWPQPPGARMAIPAAFK
jgi:hypothetical protein